MQTITVVISPPWSIGNGMPAGNRGRWLDLRLVVRVRPNWRLSAHANGPAASQTGDADSSTTPGLFSGFQGFMNINNGTLL